MRHWRKILVTFMVVLALLLTPVAGLAQEAEPPTTISVQPAAGVDQRISERLKAVFNEIEVLDDVTVSTNEGVVALGGKAPNDTAAKRASDLARRMEGVVAVEDQIARTLSVEDNFNPILDRVKGAYDAISNAWPLYVAALLAFLFVALLGHLLASAKRFWRMVAPNPFVADLVAQSIRVVGILLGLLLALSVLDAMALFGAAAGSAGLVGLAVGFALKDTIENYVASIMLSLRQPFRADDHVVINSHEGVVVRLTSRATILMTLDGNHLRLPNADVFKGTILNYTLNPHRRFTFKLGVDAEDDPIEASAAGLEAMRSLPFLLDRPMPSAVVEEVGDSNIVIEFGGWIDQDKTDFLKSRSAAINVVKSVLESDGFTLPEPIYRLRLEGISTSGAATGVMQTVEQVPKANKPAKPSIVDRENMDVEPNVDIRHQVAKERQSDEQEDLLSKARPME